MPCSRIQRRRARATSVRSCSAARRLFFESHLVALEEAPHRGATASNLVLAHRQDHLIQRQVRSFLDQTQQKIRVLLQRRGAPAPRLGRAAARLTKAPHPDDCRARADLKLFGCLTPRRSALDFRDHTLPHVPRVCLWRAPCKGGAFQWVQGPPGRPLQPEATGAVMEVTKWLKPSDSVSRYT